MSEGSMFDVGGRAMTAADLLKAAPARKKVSRSGRSEYHKGFSVQGYPPGALEAARQAAQRDLDKWERTDENERAGLRAPKPFDEVQWVTTTRRKKVRPSPYELEAVADECKVLAERAGWTHVVVVEVKRGVA